MAQQREKGYDTFMLKKFGQRLIISLFLLVLMLFLVLSALLITVRPNNVKTWLSKSGLYAVVPDLAVSRLAENQSSGTGDFTFKDVLVQRAVHRALSGNFIPNATNAVVDGTFRWLDGDVAKPDFAVKVGDAKQRFADELATAAQKRYEQLPVCGPRQQPTNLGPLTIDCQIQGYNIKQTIADFKNRVLANQDFLPSSVLTAESNLTTDSATGKVQPIIHYSKVIPQRYQQLQLARWIALGMIICLGLLLLFISDSRLSGVKRIGWSLLTTSIISALGLWLLFVAVNSLKGRIPVSLSEEGLRDALLQLTDVARRDVTTAASKIAAAYAAIGLVLIIGAHLKTRNRTPKQTPAESLKKDTPQTSTTTQ